MEPEAPPLSTAGDEDGSSLVGQGDAPKDPAITTGRPDRAGSQDHRMRIFVLALAGTLIVVYEPTLLLVGFLEISSGHGGIVSQFAWVGAPPFLFVGSALWTLGIWALARDGAGLSLRAAAGFWILGLVVSLMAFFWWTAHYTV
jgi:hypothetical protein